MIFFRIAWGLLLAGLVAFTFHRANAWEHGKPLPEPLFGDPDKPRTKSTVVWLVPTFLPVLLLTLLLLFHILAPQSGVQRFLALSLELMLLISVYFALMLLLLPLLRRCVSARACATMWLLPVFLYWQISVLLQSAPMPRWVLYIPAAVLDRLCIVWIAGFALVFAARVAAHLRFRRRVMACAVPVADPEALALWNAELVRADYGAPVKLVTSAAVAAPLSMGLLRRSRVTVLPERGFAPQELEFIFRHELRHIQRCDVDTKVFLAFCGALCWFNPLVWLAIRKASSDLELSCDEAVLEGADAEGRKAYAALLLRAAGRAPGFTTCLSAAGETMRYRLHSVVAPQRRLPGILLLAVSMFLCAMAYGTVAVSSARGSVGTLILGEDFSAQCIDFVGYSADGEQRLSPMYGWDGEALLAQLSGLEVEQLSSAGRIRPAAQGAQLSILFPRDGQLMELYLSGQLLTLSELSGSSATAYRLRAPADWPGLLAALAP